MSVQGSEIKKKISMAVISSQKSYYISTTSVDRAENKQKISPYYV